MGTAAFGKTRQEPLRPRLRAQRGRPRQPRRAMSTVDVPQEEWYPIPVPAIVEPEVVAAVQEQWQENRRHARQSRRGALYLLQGLLQCQHCGSAYYGKRLSPSARKGKPRAYAYYRCLGSDAYRFGGNASVRIPRCGRIWWTSPSGRKSVHCWRTLSAWRRNIGAGCSLRPAPHARPWPRLRSSSASYGKVWRG